jgi:Flp pilus assembly protein TadB
VIKQIALYLAAILLIAASILFLVVSKSALISFIVAFITSSLVVLASFKNYKSVVQKRLESLEDVNEVENKDVIDKIEDPYGLYEEEELNSDVKEAIKKQKEILKRNKKNIKEVTKNSAVAFKPIRIIAYAILVGGFFYLLKSNNLNLKFYLPSLIIPNIIAVIYLLNYKK